MKTTWFQILIRFGPAALLVLSMVAVPGCRKTDCEPFPSEVVASAVSVDGTATVRVLAYRGEPGDMLGAGVQFYLSIERNGSTMIVTRDLSEGFGTYEGGIEELLWLGPNQILVKRVVADRSANIVFELSSGRWEESQNNELPVEHQ